MAPLGALQARALELLDAVKRQPVVLQAHSGLYVKAGPDRPLRSPARVLAVEEEATDFELLFETAHFVVGQFPTEHAHVTLVHIARHIEALERPARREPRLQSTAPGLAVPKIGQAVALEVVVGHVEL